MPALTCVRIKIFILCSCFISECAVASALNAKNIYPAPQNLPHLTLDALFEFREPGRQIREPDQHRAGHIFSWLVVHVHAFQNFSGLLACQIFSHMKAWELVTHL